MVYYLQSHSLPALKFIPVKMIRPSFINDLGTTKTILRISSPEDLVFDSYGKPIFRHHPLEPKYLMYLPRLRKEPDSFKKLKQSDVKYLIKDQYYGLYRENYKSWFDENFVQTKEHRYIFVRIENNAENNSDSSSTV